MKEKSFYIIFPKLHFTCMFECHLIKGKVLANVRRYDAFLLKYIIKRKNICFLYAGLFLDLFYVIDKLIRHIEQLQKKSHMTKYSLTRSLVKSDLFCIFFIYNNDHI